MRYGITPEQLAEMVITQEGRCKICEQPSPNLSIDHCHTTGVVRGLLCRSCNTAIGHFRDDPEVMQRAIEYLSKAAEQVS